MKMKKLLVLSLAIIMLLGCMTLTAFADDTTYDYTLVLCDGIAHQNSEDGVDVSAEMSTAGLTYADGVWTMNNFNFKTTNSKCVIIASETTINVIGNNTITGIDSSSNSSPCGMKFSCSTTIKGTGTLTVTAGAGEGHSRAIMISNENVSLVIEGITLVANGGNSNGFSSYGFYCEESDATVTVNNANVTFNGGAVTGQEKESAGMYAGAKVIVNGTGKITGIGKSSADGNVYGIFGLREGTSAVAKDGNGTLLTWNEDDEDFKDADGNYTTTVVLTSENPTEETTSVKPAEEPSSVEPAEESTSVEPAEEKGNGWIVVLIIIAVVLVAVGIVAYIFRDKWLKSVKK